LAAFSSSVFWAVAGTSAGATSSVATGSSSTLGASIVTITCSGSVFISIY